MKIERRTELKSLKETAGFTLLEVLVALALLGIAVTAILQLFSANLKSISASEEYVAGSLEAQSKMREVLDGTEFSEKSWNGITDNGYRFQVSVSDTLKERVGNPSRETGGGGGEGLLDPGDRGKIIDLEDHEDG